MIFLLRAFSVLSLLMAILTLIRPQSGWGRIGLFIPKLFAGTFIVFFSILGLICAVSGWLIFQDPIALGLGIAGTVVALRYVFRLVIRSRHVVRKITEPRTPDEWSSSGMLPYPWIGFWRTPPNTPWRRDVVIDQNAQTGNKILADIWSPPESIKASGICIIFLHGSGWHYADKDFGTRHFFKHLARQGHIILDLAYSLATAVDIFGMVTDIKQAIIWVKQHSKELNIHDDRVVLMGGSAGGHLALLAAYTSGNARFDPPDLSLSTSVYAVVSYYGPTDLQAQFDRFCELPALTGDGRFERMFMRYLEARTGFQVIPVHGLIPRLLGGSPPDVPEIYDLASPIHYASGNCPPTLLLQGNHDFSGVSSQVVQLHKSLLQTGAISYLLELPGTEHGFDLYKPNWSPAAQAATFVTERFLASLS